MKIAVVGLGFMGSTHLKALRGIAGAELAAVVSSDERKLSGDLTGIQGNIGGPGEKMDFSQVRKYRSLSDALADRDIEAVDICLPTALHADAAIAALRAGKHVLVEKPMALDGAAADAVVDEARRSGRVLMTGQVLRFIGAYRTAAGKLKSGSLGALRSAFLRRRCAAPAWSRWLGDPVMSGGGAFDLLIHDVDFCIWLLGTPSAVSATGAVDPARGIDVLCARLRYESVESVVIEGGWHHPKAYPFSMEFTLVADEGTLDYGSDGRPLTLYGADGEKRALDPGDPDWYGQELRYFVECASSGRSPSLCPPEESALAVRIARLMTDARNDPGKELPVSGGVS